MCLRVLLNTPASFTVCHLLVKGLPAPTPFSNASLSSSSCCTQVGGMEL